MRKPVTPPGKAGTTSFGPPASPFGARPQVSAANSNTRVFVGAARRQPSSAGPAGAGPGPSVAASNLGLNSERSRAAMVGRLRDAGITDDRVLGAMMAVPRHVFVDEGLASRAYDDAALPIGYSQTISQPWVVARMVSAVIQQKGLSRVLEVGAGCGYQAAVLAQLVPQVHAIERIRGLYQLAQRNLQAVGLEKRVRLVYGDGMAGLPAEAPFDAIIVAAAGLAIPPALLQQLAPGGRLIAPEGDAVQRLVLIERTGQSTWKRDTLEEVRFVPLRSGIQS